MKKDLTNTALAGAVIGAGVGTVAGTITGAMHANQGQAQHDRLVTERDNVKAERDKMALDLQIERKFADREIERRHAETSRER